MPRSIIGSTFHIQPGDINISRDKGFEHFWDAFDQYETEVSAYYIVALCQERGGWIPFTLKEIEDHYQRAGRHLGFSFNRLVEPGHRVLNAADVFAGSLPQTEQIGGGWIMLGDDGKYYVTDDFAKRCYQSSPVK